MESFVYSIYKNKKMLTFEYLIQIYMKIKLLSLLAFFMFGSAFSQSLQSPSEFLGYEIGTRFTRHHQVVDYFKYVSNTVSNVNWKNMEKQTNTDRFM